MLEKNVGLVESGQIPEGVGEGRSENKHFYGVCCILVILSALLLAQSLK